MTADQKISELPSELRRAAKISTSGYWAGVLLEAADEIERLTRMLRRANSTLVRHGLAEMPVDAGDGRLLFGATDDVTRRHVEGEHCWCHPTLNYTNPETGAKHWIHHEPS